MFGIGGWEMLLIAVVALLVFGPKRLPDLARQMGKGLSEFRRASSDLRRSFDLELDPTRTPAPAPETQPPAQTGDIAKPLPEHLDEANGETTTAETSAANPATASAANPATASAANPATASAANPATASAASTAKPSAEPVVDVPAESKKDPEARGG